jgi:hypothetical protein
MTSRADGLAVRHRRPRVEQHVEPLVFADVAEEERDLVVWVEAQPAARRVALHGGRVVREESILAVGNHGHALWSDRELIDQALLVERRVGDDQRAETMDAPVDGVLHTATFVRRDHVCRHGHRDAGEPQQDEVR